MDGRGIRIALTPAPPVAGGRGGPCPPSRDSRPASAFCVRPGRLLAVFALAVLAAVPPAASFAASLDRVAAVVDGNPILASEVERRFRHLVFDLRQRSARLPAREALVRRAVDELIVERLQLRIADALGLRVTDRELDRALASIARRYGLGIDGLRGSIESAGIPFSEFRTRIHDDLLIERVRQREVLSRISVTDAEIDRYLAQPAQARSAASEYLVGHILISRSDGEAAARARMEEVLRGLRAGEAFADLARRHSSGRHAAEGGTLGWRTAAALPSQFAGLVPRLKPGEVSGAIESPSGFHVVKLIDTRRSGQSFVRQTRASHILVVPDALVSREEARLRLERLRSRAMQGEDFGELARFHSDNPTSAVHGGDLGWLSPGMAPPDFEAVMDGLGEGELSEPFETASGWHLLKVLERRNHDNTEEVERNRARNAIFERKAGEALAAWLGRLRDSAFIRVRLDE